MYKVISCPTDLLKAFEHLMERGLHEEAFTAMGHLLETHFEATCIKLQPYILNLLADKVYDNDAPLLLLASTSARRIDILSQLSQSHFLAIDPRNEQEYDVSGVSSPTTVTNIALQKLLSYINKNATFASSKALLLSSDTLLTLPDGTRLGKVKDESSVRSHLGQTLIATTGLALLNLETKTLQLSSATTTLTFRRAEESLSPSDLDLLSELSNQPSYAYLSEPLSSAQLKTVGDIVRFYCSEGKHINKAGGFGIQDRELFVCIKALHGDPFVVVGLPLNTLSTLQPSALKPTLPLWEHYWPAKSEQERILP